MKILHTADLHVGRTLNGVSILSQQIHCLNQMINYIKKNPVDYFIIAGDVYDRSIPNKEAIKVVNDFITQINELNIPLLIISGNHDSGERLAFLASILNKNNIFIVSDDIEIQKISFHDVDFYLSPYFDYLNIARYYNDTTITNSELALKKQLENINLSNKINIFIAHHFFADDFIEISESERPLQVGGMNYISATYLKKFNYVALGHLHKAQQVSFNNIRYSGSIYKYSESEVNHIKSFTVIDIDNDKFHYTQIPFNLDKDVIIKKGYLQDLLQHTDQNFIYFHLLDSTIQLNAMNLLVKQYPNAIGIKYINIEQKIQTYTSSKLDLNSINELFKEYYKITHNKEINSVQNDLYNTVYNKEET